MLQAGKERGLRELDRFARRDETGAGGAGEEGRAGAVSLVVLPMARAGVLGSAVVEAATGRKCRGGHQQEQQDDEKAFHAAKVMVPARALKSKTTALLQPHRKNVPSSCNLSVPLSHYWCKRTTYAVCCHRLARPGRGLRAAHSEKLAHLRRHLARRHICPRTFCCCRSRLPAVPLEAKPAGRAPQQPPAAGCGGDRRHIHVPPRPAREIQSHLAGRHPWPAGCGRFRGPDLFTTLIPMRIFGHPIHPLLVHFPTALFPVDFVLLLFYRHSGTASYYTASWYCLCAGVAGGAAALLTGLIDGVGVFRRQKEALPALLYHASLNAFVLLSYGVLAAKAAPHFPEPFRADNTGILIRVILLAALIFGNYFGGRLVYTYRVGIQNKSHDHPTIH
ncbi:MAG: DUF2231 domain-containing protein [Chitinophagaceae bacterium]|nr:MAG: DUF2231 domain-containing protein [Chitinophagaceae bacterium]